MKWNIKRFDAVIFDLDGTLVDSLPDMTLALNKCLGDQGRQQLKVEEVRPLIGQGASRMIQSAFELTGGSIGGVHLDKAIANYTLHYKEFPAEKSRVYDNVRVVLSELFNANIKMGICSNKAYELVRLILEAFDLEKYFCAVTGGDNFEFNKPDGRHILETLKLMGVFGTNVLMVGDTLNDVDAAADAGVQSIAVNYGYSNPKEFTSSIKVIDSLKHLSG